MSAFLFRRYIFLMASLVAGITGVHAAGNSDSAPHWPQWRGPRRDAVADEQNLLKQWPDEGPPVLWSTTGAGTGYASVVIADGRLITLGDREDGCYAICFPTGGGEPLWATRIGDRWNDGGPRCTPTIANDLLYALTPHGNLCCLAVADGAVKWQKDMAKDFGGKMMSGWGYSESPLVDGDRLICSPGADDAAVVALSALTGELIWKASIPDCGGAGYSSPVKTLAAGVPQYVTVLGNQGGAVGVRASDGKLLWRHSRVAGRVANIPTPIVRDDLVFYSTGYDDGGCALLKLT
ncbi:MAG: PQQ-binding-like beta-propeller repeat protein, partial [Planctomycetales bacterium]|nr:PQQ-binding-like beta-propeller repeat protein [Planctomycetales bacterium]